MLYNKINLLTNNTIIWLESGDYSYNSIKYSQVNHEHFQMEIGNVIFFRKISLSEIIETWRVRSWILFILLPDV